VQILVVEDDPGVRGTVVRMLEFLGHTVESVRAGDEAEALPNDRPFDVVLTDQRLPGTPGHLLVKRLCERWPGLQAVIMSGNVEGDELRAGLLDGRWRLLPKPFSFDQLTDQLRGLAAPDEAPVAR
jgi:DNA-binding NtrC family response regulator